MTKKAKNLQENVSQFDFNEQCGQNQHRPQGDDVRCRFLNFFRVSFRQKIFLSYLIVFIILIVLLSPFIAHRVEDIMKQSMESRANEIISTIYDAPNHEALVRRLKDQKSVMFFRSSIITDEHKVLYDSHAKRALGPKFSSDYVTVHPEVVQAMQEGRGYREGYSELLSQEFAYYAKAFDFHGKTYVLRTGYPFKYVTEMVHDFKFGFFGLAVLILMLFSMMTWFVIHYLVRPIQRIIDTIRPYQEGKMPSLPAIELNEKNVNDDFHQLALTLNGLSKKIQNHIDLITQERNEKETILESLVEGVIAVTEDLKVTYTNPTALRLLNCKESLRDRSFSVLSQKECEELLKQCQLEKRPLTQTLETLCEGQKLYLDIVATPQKNNTGAVLVLHDKTEHYKLSDMRRDFIANASHELKTPITIIRGYAEALHENVSLSLDTQHEITGKIMRSCDRMSSLIKDLLTLADVENIPFSRLSDVDLVEVLNECKGRLLEVFPAAKVEIIAQHETLFADRDLIELAFMNLIENAAKYSNPPVCIRVTIEENEESIIVRIADKGIGIPQADLEHIFDRFYTVDKAHSQKMGGSGLGLSIVKTIVEKSGGTIAVQSEVSKGSTFILCFPKHK